MGCDIHMYVEYKVEIKDKETWISGDYFKANKYHLEWEDEEKLERMELHGRRNYGLFAVLAGVRDYTDKVVPVAADRGIPDDACDYVKKENDSWGGDGHSHSWVTLKELKEYQSNSPKIHYTGLLAPAVLEDFDKNGTLPQSWCQGTNQEGYERRNWTEESKHLVPLIEAMQKRSHELHQYDWQDYDLNNDEKIRIVFWFDN